MAQPMRRSFAEWGLLLSCGVLFASVTLLVASFLSNWPKDCYALINDRWGRGILYVQVLDGSVYFFSEPDFDADFPRPYIVNPRTNLAPKIQTIRSFSAPGFAFNSCRFVTGYLVWSLGFSMTFPAAISSLMAAHSIRQLRRVHRLAPTEMAVAHESDARS
ncbi:hypothetical protein EP7_002801 [Isosphaeraceae bacterium EP7]